MPAVRGRESATVVDEPEEGPLQPVAVTPITALPEKEGFQETVAVPPDEVIDPAASYPVGLSVQL